MRSPLGIATVALLVLTAAVPASAHAGKKATTDQLWATVNVCDTKKRPDTLGVRGSMPGTGKTGEMFMRFRVQFYSAKTKKWRTVSGDNADSGYMSAGSSRYKVRQTGASFHFEPPASGAYTLRGRVEFEWRAKGKVVKDAVELTERGHRSVTGADPKDYSAGTCKISG